jgi:adenylosuccinate synthase
MSQKGAVIVADLGFGDAGKGTMVDYLARQAESAVVVRYNGGPQAAHNVVTMDGRQHTFAQMGSGTFVPGVKTHLSRFMLVNPFNLDREIEYLARLGVADCWERLSIDAGALVITPWHIAANRLREMARGNGRHGSCGQGIGETQWDAIEHPDQAVYARDLASPAALWRKLEWIQGYKYEQIKALSFEKTSEAEHELRVFDPEFVKLCTDFYGWFADQAKIVDAGYLGQLLDSHQKAIFEGAQGVLLDEWFGFHPYTTWSTTTLENAETLLFEQGYDEAVTRLGVIRGYGVRHGPGPFPTEDAGLTHEIPDYHNETNRWQREFRVGHLDLVATRYAIDVCQGIDALAVTNIDRMANHRGWKVATAYRPHAADDAHKHLVMAGNLAKGIRLGVKDNLDYQEAITNLLTRSAAVYQGVETPSGHGILSTEEDIEAYLDVVADGLNTPITHLSLGPTAEHKRCLALTNN